MFNTYSSSGASTGLTWPKRMAVNLCGLLRSSLTFGGILTGWANPLLVTVRIFPVVGLGNPRSGAGIGSMAGAEFIVSAKIVTSASFFIVCSL